MTTKRVNARKQSRNKKAATRKVPKSSKTAVSARRHAAGDTAPDLFGRPMEAVTTAARRRWLQRSLLLP